MNNKDLPAMPIPLTDGQGFSHHTEADGLTKREYFAAHAPDMPEWYRIHNRCSILMPEDVLSDVELTDYQEYRRGNYGHERYHEGEKASIHYNEECRKHNYKEAMRVFAEWRWHYADMMLEGE